MAGGSRGARAARPRVELFASSRVSPIHTHATATAAEIGAHATAAADTLPARARARVAERAAEARAARASQQIWAQAVNTTLARTRTTTSPGRAKTRLSRTRSPTAKASVAKEHASVIAADTEPEDNAPAAAGQSDSEHLHKDKELQERSWWSRGPLFSWHTGPCARLWSRAAEAASRAHST